MGLIQEHFQALTAMTPTEYQGDKKEAEGQDDEDAVKEEEVEWPDFVCFFVIGTCVKIWSLWNQEEEVKEEINPETGRHLYHKLIHPSSIPHNWLEATSASACNFDSIQ